MQITLVTDSLAPNSFVLVPLDSLTLIRQPPWMGAIFQYGGCAQLLKFLNFFKSAILQYGRQDAIFKYNITVYNMAAIFKL